MAGEATTKDEKVYDLKELHAKMFLSFYSGYWILDSGF
jgi:hypothetical protein